MNIEALDIVLIVVMLILSAVFSGVETAFLSANRLKIELKSAQGDEAGILLSRFLKQTPHVLSTLVLFGIAMGRLSGSITAGLDWVDPLKEPYLMLLIETSIAALVILYFGEFLPKAFFKLRADQIMLHRVVAKSLAIYVRLLGPLARATNAFARLLLRVFMGMRHVEEELVFSKEDLNHYLQETFGTETDDEAKPEIDEEMFTNAMTFNEVRVKEFMVPRTELSAMPIEASVEELLDYFISQGHSRVVIYKDNLDEVLGIVHHSAMFKRPQTIAEVLQPALMVPESMAANLLLSEFNKHRKTIAVVVDEFGGTEGIVTIEDLVEVVFGEIEDEHDEPEDDDLLAKQVAENVWLLSARHEVKDLNEEWKLGLPEGDGEYSTLAGLIIHHLEAIPSINDIVEIPGFKIEITDASDTKLNIVKVQRL
jgi:putative hemolysin